MATFVIFMLYLHYINLYYIYMNRLADTFIWGNFEELRKTQSMHQYEFVEVVLTKMNILSTFALIKFHTIYDFSF